jgi:hypothetical protein
VVVWATVVLVLSLVGLAARWAEPGDRLWPVTELLYPPPAPLSEPLKPARRL